MKRLTITIIALFATQALAQEAPDPALQLLNEANARVVDLARQLQTAQKRANEAEAKLKPPAKPADPERK